jgi:hypothetical protein
MNEAQPSGDENNSDKALTQEQVAFLIKLGVSIPDGCTRKQASDLIVSAQSAKRKRSSEPATQKQLAYLTKLGGEYPDPCTKKEAGRLIDQAQELQDSEEWMGQPSPRGQRKMLEDGGFNNLPTNLTRKGAAEYFEDIRWKTILDETSREMDESYEETRRRMEPNPFWAAHEDVITAERILKEAKKAKKKNDEEFRKSTQQLSVLEKEEERINRLLTSRDESLFDITSLVRLRVELGMLQAKIEFLEALEEPDPDEEFFDEKEALKEAKEYRVGMWKVSFSKDMDNGDEMDFFICGPMLQKMYDEIGCHFRKPSIATIKSLLKTLDSENETWDRDNPVQFFERLSTLDDGKYRARQNPVGTQAPQQRAASRQQAKKGGCIGVLFGAVLLAAVVFGVLLKG